MYYFLMKIPILVLIILIVLIAIYLAYGYWKQPKTTYQYAETNVVINGKTFVLEIADTPGKRSKGLMYRTNLDDDKGMLFIFDKSGIYPFWMKDTYVPLDIIWVNSEGFIVAIKEDAKPCDNIASAICQSIIPSKPAKYVIELNSGKVASLGLKIGDGISSLGSR